MYKFKIKINIMSKAYQLQTKILQITEKCGFNNMTIFKRVPNCYLFFYPVYLSDLYYNSYAS